MNRKNLIYRDESYKILGACFDVYKTMGSGFLESVYQECLELELTKRGIPFSSQKRLKLRYGDTVLNQHYIPDLICYDKIIVELKTVSNLTKKHEAQIINYLHATEMKLGLLINFGHHPKIEYMRRVL